MKVNDTKSMWRAKMIKIKKDNHYNGKQRERKQKLQYLKTQNKHIIKW